MRSFDYAQITWGKTGYFLGLALLAGLVIMLIGLQVALMSGNCASLLGEECRADFQPQWSTFSDMFATPKVADAR